jgi:4'-phosphopantetheinyl transferase EntD
MSDAQLLKDLFSKALRDLPVGLSFAIEQSSQSDYMAMHVAGRTAARRALNEAGYEGLAELPANAYGAPDWPAGWVGSITHSKGICAAIVAQQKYFTALGVDIEHFGRMRSRTLTRVATAAELANLSECDLLHHATVLFSLKEAFYKAQHPHYKTTPKFHDLQLKWSIDQGRAEIIGVGGVIEKKLQNFCQNIILYALTDTSRVLSVACVPVDNSA